MKRLLVLLLIITSTQLFAQSEKYSKVKIFLQGRPVSELAQLGLDVEHGLFIKYRWLVSDFSKSELQLIESHGFEYDVLIEDVKAYYVAQNSTPQPALKRANDCNDVVIDYPTPANFNLGNMGGFFTYQEMLDELDSMAMLYPNLISPRAAIDSSNLTFEGRMIYWLRISDNPNTNENEPEALYTSLHHSREPGSLSQMIYYMWYLLENYGIDPEITYLLDNTELYFVPCVNPDGYVYNQTNDPNGGGLWRKNRRNNGNGTFGVDLNRNYGYEWGIDNTGSSPSTNSDTYRGPSPFSEPETQNVRDLCDRHEFQIALNYHTYGNLLIHPWGFDDSQTPDSSTFRGFARYMTRENKYVTGTGTETVGYIVNGDSDDWMYGDTTNKPKIFSLTPEAGPDSYGFWPPSTAIDQICKENMLQNLALPRLLLNFGEVRETGVPYISSTIQMLPFEVTRLGLTAGPLEVSITPISSNIVTAGSPKTFNLQQFESAIDSISYSVNPAIQFGDEVVFLLNINNGATTYSDTVRKIYQVVDPAFVDAGGDLSNWQNSGNTWQVTTLDYYTAPSCFTDSPFGFYNDNDITELVTLEPIRISDSTELAVLRFWARWDIEAEYDYAQVLASTTGNFYTPLCGKYTKEGSQFQDQGEPVWDGKQDTWVQEEVNLIDYKGQEIYLKFWLVSDQFVNGDGFLLDDIELLVTQIDSVPIDTTTPIDTTDTIGVGLSLLDFDWGQNYPNPADNFTIIQMKPNSGPVRLQVLNAMGQTVFTKAINTPNTTEVYVNTRSWAPGIYHYHLLGNDGRSKGKSLVISR